MGIDLERSSAEHHKVECRPTGSGVVEDGVYGGRNTDGATISFTLITGVDKERIRLNAFTRRLASNNKMHAGEGVAPDSHITLELHEGMEFESKEDAFSFYKEYAKSVGFAAIIKASRRSRISGKFIDAKFVCTRYGSKRESITSETAEPVSNADSMASIPLQKKRGRIDRSWLKTDCKACLHVKRRQDGRWIIHGFIREHNHKIFPDQACYFHGHRDIDLGNNDGDTLHAVRTRTKKMYMTMPRQYGGTKKIENQKSDTTNASGQHLSLDKGDVQVMLEHFMNMQDENPNFFYAIKLNQEQRLRIVCWVDPKGRVDYGNFNDVVFFDTTYIKNECKLSFAPFIGINHHCQLLLLGCAIIADESKSTFAWVMQAWLRAMGGPTPKVILTDQDTALKEAISEVFPDSRHCFCLWQVMSRIQEKLGYVMRQHENLSAKFKKCILKSSTAEQFEKRWWKLIDKFDLKNHLWLQSVYEDRERWVPAYMRDIFLAGMSTLQRSESMNTFLDKCMQHRTTLKEFIDQYKAMLRERYEEEAKADFETWHKQPGLKSPSPFGKQMAAIYTRAIFRKFQVEVLGVVGCHPKKQSQDGLTATFKIQDLEENRDFIVLFNERTSDISCSCRLFEYNGFLCRHVMIVLQICGVHKIPSQYILKRWTKDAKSRETTRKMNFTETRVQRYNDLCRRAFILGDKGSLCQESYKIAFSALKEALSKCKSFNNSTQSALEPTSPSNYGLHDFEEVTQGNCMNITNKKTTVSKKGKVQPELGVMTTGMDDEWQQMGQLNSRVPCIEGLFSTQQFVQGMGHLDTITPSHDDYYSDQPSMHRLGQLSSLAPIHDGHYLGQQRLQGLGQLRFRPQSIQSCLDVQDSMQDTDQ